MMAWEDGYTYEMYEAEEERMRRRRRKAEIEDEMADDDYECRLPFVKVPWENEKEEEEE